MKHIQNNVQVDYDWKRDRLYDQELCQSLLDACRSNPIARIISISEGETRKARPLPLNTVVSIELEYILLLLLLAWRVDLGDIFTGT